MATTRVRVKDVILAAIAATLASAGVVLGDPLPHKKCFNNGDLCGDPPPCLSLSQQCNHCTDQQSEHRECTSMFTSSCNDLGLQPTCGFIVDGVCASDGQGGFYCVPGVIYGTPCQRLDCADVQ